MYVRRAFSEKDGDSKKSISRARNGSSSRHNSSGQHRDPRSPARFRRHDFSPRGPNKLWVELYGGLGNTLFQIAAGWSLARQHGYEFAAIPPVLNPHKTCDYARFYGAIEFSHPPARAIKVIETREQHYAPPILPPGPVILKGYWQCPKYFDRDEIKKLFGVEAVETRAGTVALHVRRGDYLKYPNVHPVCGVEYYRAAVDALGVGAAAAQATYYIFSDDIAWCKKNLDFIPRKEFITANEMDSLLQMMECEYIIIANSTYSWWGAYLSNAKRVIAPKNWLVGRDTDIYCAEWDVV